MLRWKSWTKPSRRRTRASSLTRKWFLTRCDHRHTSEAGVGRGTCIARTQAGRNGDACKNGCQRNQHPRRSCGCHPISITDRRHCSQFIGRRPRPDTDCERQTSSDKRHTGNEEVVVGNHRQALKRRYDGDAAGRSEVGDERFPSRARSQVREATRSRPNEARPQEPGSVTDLARRHSGSDNATNRR